MHMMSPAHAQSGAPQRKSWRTMSPGACLTPPERLQRAFAFCGYRDAVFAHEPLHALAVYPLPLPAQLCCDPGRPVCPPVLGVDLFDRPDELGLGQLRGAGLGRLAGGPVVEPLAADAGRPARGCGREPLRPPGSDPPIAGHCPDSFTQKAVARMAAHASSADSSFPGATAPTPSAPWSSDPVFRPGRCGPGEPSSPLLAMASSRCDFLWQEMMAAYVGSHSRAASLASTAWREVSCSSAAMRSSRRAISSQLSCEHSTLTSTVRRTAMISRGTVADPLGGRPHAIGPAGCGRRLPLAHLPGKCVLARRRS